MALSRTARILIAVLLLAAAGFFWVNFFQQDPTTTATGNGAGGVPTQGTTVPGTPAPLSGGQAPGSTANDIATTSEENGGNGVGTVDPVGTPGVAATTTPTGAAGDPTSPVVPGDATAGGTAAPVTVTDPPAVVLRDLVVEELPFLVTEPPAITSTDVSEESDDGGRAQNAPRANVNPFSPILVQAPPSQAAPTPVASTPSSPAPDVVVVDSSPAPGGTSGSGTPTTVTSTPVPAPAPRAMAPAPVRTAELPRPLPSGTLSAVPDILRDSRSQQATPAGPADLGTLAAVIVPDDSSSATLPFAERGSEVTAATSPEVLGPDHAEQQARANAATTLPLAVGADPLSRYLRDNNVRFTGTALGPLSVGVFRSNIYQQPVVVTLGQTLPETDILLSDLRGYEAKFSLGDNTQVLSLDLRR